MKKYYDILELKEGASQDDIKKKFKQLAFQYHPDRNNGNSDKFLKVKEAYEILTGKNNSAGQNTDEFDFDVLNNRFGNFGDFFNFSGFGSRPSREQRPPDKDSDIRFSIETNVLDVKNGKTISIKYSKSKTCDLCNGVGGKSVNSCDKCKGKGHVQNVHRRGNSLYFQSYPCHECKSSGEITIDSCSLCKGKGYELYDEELTFSIQKVDK